MDLTIMIFLKSFSRKFNFPFPTTCLEFIFGPTSQFKYSFNPVTEKIEFHTRDTLIEYMIDNLSEPINTKNFEKICRHFIFLCENKNFILENPKYKDFLFQKIKNACSLFETPVFFLRFINQEDNTFMEDCAPLRQYVQYITRTIDVFHTGKFFKKKGSSSTFYCFVEAGTHFYVKNLSVTFRNSIVKLRSGNYEATFHFTANGKWKYVDSFFNNIPCNLNVIKYIFWRTFKNFQFWAIEVEHSKNVTKKFKKFQIEYSLLHSLPEKLFFLK